MPMRYTAFSKTRQQRWMRAGSILISLAAVTLLGTAFGAHFYSGSLSSLLLGDQAVCLGANPAALQLFGTNRQELVGEPIQKFFTCAGDFMEGWDRYLDRKSEHRETRVLRGDGEAVFVEYTAKA